MGNESYASVHRKAVRESLQLELNRALAKIWDSTHCATWDGKIYMCGTLKECRDFIEGLGNRAKVRPITIKEQHALAKHKRQAFHNP